jgi:glycerol-3-phosphate dehydrogenase
VLSNPSGLLTIVGGKLTTYRRMAQDTVDVLNRRDGITPMHPTLMLPLQGSANWPARESELARRGEQIGLSLETIQHLVKSYGSETQCVLDLVASDPALARPLIADLPYLYAEVVAACRYEMALTPADVLARRTAIALEDRQRGLGVLDEVAACMAHEAGWSHAQQMELAELYRADILRQLSAETASLATRSHPAG